MVWLAKAPDKLRISAGAEGLVMTASLAGRLFNVLAVLAAITAFGLWIWFVRVDWHRVWNRLSTFSPGYDDTHATKLEVYWLLMGWALGPAFAGFAFFLAGHWFDEIIHGYKMKRMAAFARRQLDGALAELVEQALAGCSRDGLQTANLGQAHTGAPHPTHPNIVYSEKGEFRPAAGYVWSSTDPASLEVKPAVP